MKYRKGTFVVVPNIDLLEGKQTELQVLFMWLCSFADENGQCFPSRKLLAKKCGLTVRTIDKYVDMLVDLKIIEKKKKEFSSNLYQVVLSNTLPSVVEDMTPSAPNIPITIPSINYTQLSSKEPSKEVSKIDKIEIPYSFEDELKKLSSSTWVVNKIIYNYWKIKGFKFDNMKQFKSALSRELRPAKALEGYTSSQIMKGIEYCQNNYKDIPWKLETVGKVINEVVNKK